MYDDRVRARFNAKICPEPNTGCWLWTAGTTTDGYGLIGKVSGKRSMRAHRLAWELANGRLIPNGMVVMHSCDTPPCCNPDHLSVGTISDNTLDAYAKGRKIPPYVLIPACIARGEGHGNAKLTADKVRELRRRRALGESYPSLAKGLGVAATNIRNAVLGITWSHVN